ncbi:hypothetical protein WJX73_002756 [Symbiochloris irregularis]|uniref:Major facilitator superfamily (MFS) profile domain-containing protein n=1 Tax=Symbiochloris irregularis TaxID=706552 RepID=A0AAW1NN70_9CHLO
MAFGRREQEEPKRVGVLRDIFTTPVWRLFPLFVLYVICLTTLTPIKPNLMTDFFASRHSDKYIHCERFPPLDSPRVCRDAHASAVLWSSWSDFFSNSILLFLLAPLVGRWSDAYGRKPFLIICFLLASLPVLVLVLHMCYQLPLYFYFPAQVLNGAFSSISIAMSYIADVIQPHNRAPVFGIIMACFYFGFLLGPLLGGLLDPVQCGVFAAGGLGACILWVILFLPETLPPAAKLAALQRLQAQPEATRLGGVNWHGLQILGRSPLFIKLTACTMVSGMVAEGVYELVAQYLQLKLGFTVQDLSHLFSLLGFSGMLVNMVLLRILISLMGETMMLRFGLLMSTVEMALLAFVRNNTDALSVLCAGTVANVSFPAIASIKSNNVAPHEQGTIQGALYGARALAQGVGPLIFAALFTVFSKGSFGLPIFPGAPFIAGSIFMAVALAITFSINRRAADSGGYMKQLTDPIHDPLLYNPMMAPEEAEVDEHKPQGDLLPQGAPNAFLGLAPQPDSLQPLGEDLWVPYHQGPHAQQNDGPAQAGQNLTAGSRPSDHEVSVYVGPTAQDGQEQQTAEV